MNNEDSQEITRSQAEDVLGKVTEWSQLQADTLKEGEVLFDELSQTSEPVSTSVFADGNVKEYLQKLVAGIGLRGGELAIVHLELSESGAQRSKLAGLDNAIEQGANGVPTIMLSFLGEDYLANEPRWQVAMGYPHTVFRRVPIDLKDLKEAAEEARSATRIGDPLATRLLSIPSLQNNKLGALQHNLQRVLDGQGRDAWEVEARGLLGEYPFEELVDMVRSWHTDSENLPGFLEGESFNDVFVDVDGTLFDNEGELDAEVYQTVLVLSSEHPVTVWTGGNVTDAQNLLRQHKIDWKVLPKSALKGAKVAIAIDDLSKEEIEARYGVSIEEFIQA